MNSLTINKKAVATTALWASAAAIFSAEMLMAGTGATYFDNVWTLLVDWLQGPLGRIIAGSFVLVGMVAGIARSSIMALAVGLGGGIGVFYAPDIINGVVTATLPTV